MSNEVFGAGLPQRRPRSRAVAAGPVLRAGRIGGVLGVASAVLLAASVSWAHHWGPAADVLVAAWMATTLGAVTLSARRLLFDGRGRGLARLGLALGLCSVLVAVSVGVAAAAGADPASMCGGG